MKRDNSLRRTNRIEIDLGLGMVFKHYQNYPLTVIPQVVLGLRPSITLNALYRGETEQRKISVLEEAGLPLAQEYIDFNLKEYAPSLTTRYEPRFKTVEDVLGQGVSLEQALSLVGKCYAALRDLHEAGRRRANGKRIITHGDPYLENVRVLEDGSVRFFDFEQEYRCEGNDAMQMDGTILYRHALHILLASKIVQSHQDRADLREVVHQQYPALELKTPVGNAYLGLRFRQ